MPMPPSFSFLLQTVMMLLEVWKLRISCVAIVIMLFQLTHISYGKINTDEYVIVSDTLPEVRFRPPIGNGHVATNVLSETVYMNGLYSGREDFSSRARIPAYVSVDIASSQQLPFGRTYVLDMYNGLFIQKLQSSVVDVEITYFAHRTSTRLLVTQILLTRKESNIDDITLNMTSYQGADYNQLWSETSYILGQHTRYLTTTINETEVEGMQPTQIHVYHTIIPSKITLKAGKPNTTVTFIASHSMQKKDALDSYIAALRDVDNDVIARTHSQGWNNLWSEGRIDIHGNPSLSTDIAAAMYNIMCSIPGEDDHVTPFFGLSPGGLSRGGLYSDKPGGPRNDYAGHVFWDMDTWIMPTFLMFNPTMARRMLEARIRVMDQAKENARKDGFKGIKFPWEQGSTGIEVTPKYASNMSLYQIHVTADIALALRQYSYAVHDVTLMNEGRGFELALGIARFWQSRVTHTNNDTVQILGVMGPDEYHANINNSVYTNYNAKLSLTLPGYLSRKYKLEVNDTLRIEMNQFDETARKILILFDEHLNYHPQYEDFTLNVTIKQSDVVLLGYPLMMTMSSDVRRNDLELYDKITNPNGPDTGTWSMHTVGWLELGDLRRAEENFKKMFRNINGPFKVFSEKPVTETAYGGCVNFITGAGGLLQSIVFGYGGLRLVDNGLELNPTLLPNTTSWSLTGVHYMNVMFDVIIADDNTTVTITTKPADTNVIIEHEGHALSQNLHVNDRYILKSTKSIIRVDSMASTDSTGHVYPVMGPRTDPTPFTSIVTKPTVKTTTSNAPVACICLYTIACNVVILLFNVLFV